MTNTKEIYQNDTPLFEYLEEKQHEEFVIESTKEQILCQRRFYLINLSLGLMVILSICTMFFVQFKVDDLQSKIDLVQSEIDDYQNELKILNVEWYYLTRPDRLRYLANQYLTTNRSIAFNQIKDFNNLENYYLANIKKYEAETTQVSQNN